MTDLLDLTQLHRRTSAKWSAYDPDVLPMWVAEMDFPLAPPIRTRLHELVDLGDTGYAVSGPMIAAFARFAQRRYGWRVEPQLAWLCTDVMAGVEYAVERLTQAGDPVAFLTPAYPPFFVSVGDGRRRVSEVPMAFEASHPVIDLDALREALRTGARAILLCNPHNPTGRVFTVAELLRVAELADHFGVPVISDEIHAPLVLDATRHHVPFATLPAEAAANSVCVHSASKAWNLPGLKAALLVAGGPAMADRLASPTLAHLDERAGIAGVAASIAAFDQGQSWLDETVAYLAGNHDLMRELLPAALPGVRMTRAEATYLIWLDLRDVDALDTGTEPADALLKRARVALVPGTQFGQRYAGWARLNVGTSRALVREAVRRFAAGLDGAIGE